MKAFLKASLQLPATVFPCRTAINWLLHMLHWQTTTLPNFHKLPYCHRLPQTGIDCHFTSLPQTVTLPDCHRLSLSQTVTLPDCHRLPLSQTVTLQDCHRLPLSQTVTLPDCHRLPLSKTVTLQDCHRLSLSQTVTLQDCHSLPLPQTVTLPDCHRLSHCHITSLLQASSHSHKVPAREIIFQTNPLLVYFTTVPTCSWLDRALKNCSETSHKLYRTVVNCAYLNWPWIQWMYTLLQSCTEMYRKCT